MNLKSRRIKSAAGIAGLLLVAAPLAACGSSDSSSDGGSAAAIATVADLSHGKTTSVKLDSGFTDALGTLKLTPGVVGDAKLTDGSLVFPITGGAVQIFKPGTVPEYVTGQIQHENSGFSLTDGTTKVSIGNFNIDPGGSIAYGDVFVNDSPTAAYSSIPVFDLDGSTLQPIGSPDANGVVTLTGTTVHLTDGAAKLLDDTYKTDAVKGGLLIGVATLLVGTK